MTSTPRGSKHGSQIGARAIRRGRRGRAQRENLPVRNLAEDVFETQSTSTADVRRSPRKKGEEKNADAAKTMQSKKRDSSPLGRSVLSESRYNLRSWSRSDVSVQERAHHQSQFVKSVFTPSRALSQTQINVQKSKYRTPVIASEVTNFKQRKERSITKEQREIWNRDKERLLHITWRTSYLSTTVYFKYQRKNLVQSYESVLKARILEAYPSYSISVKISTTSLLNQNPREVDGIFFKVTEIVPAEAEDKEDKISVIYESFLIKTNETQSEKLPGFEWFPLMLHRGLDVLHQIFATWFQSSFGCYITPKHLPQGCLLWLAGIWSRGECNERTHHKKEELKINFHYIIRPPNTDQKFDYPNDRGKVTMKIDCYATDIRKIWNRIATVEETSVNSESVTKFHSLMETFVGSICHLPKSLLQLYHIKTSCMVLSGDGRLRLTCEKKFLSILSHLIEIFHSTCHFNNTEFDSIFSEEDLDDGDDLEEQ